MMISMRMNTEDSAAGRGLVEEGPGEDHRGGLREGPQVLWVQEAVHHRPEEALRWVATGPRDHSTTSRARAPAATSTDPLVGTLAAAAEAELAVATSVVTSAAATAPHQEETSTATAETNRRLPHKLPSPKT